MADVGRLSHPAAETDGVSCLGTVKYTACPRASLPRGAELGRPCPQPRQQLQTTQ